MLYPTQMARGGAGENPDDVGGTSKGNVRYALVPEFAHDHSSLFSRFRWVALQLDSLASCRIANDVYQRLESLPRGLDETYDRILSKIQDEDSKWAVRILECLAFSARLMTLEEVAEVVAFNPDSRQFDQRLPDPLAILDICSSLITISSGTDKMKGKSDSKFDTGPNLMHQQECLRYLTSLSKNI